MSRLHIKADFDRLTYVLVFVPLSISLIIIAAYSLKWRMVVDSSLMMYFAFVMDKFGYLPYRDFLDPNMVGTYFIYFLAGHFSNYSDLGFRIADVTYLFAILTITGLMFKKMGLKTAWAAILAFGFFYLDEGPGLSFQREFLVLLPLVLAIYLTENSTRLSSGYRFFLAGIMLGIAFSIKPHSIVFLPVLLALRTLFKYENENYTLPRIAFYSSLGFIIPVLVSFFYLWVHGILPNFFEVAFNYWPLYAQVNGEHVTQYGQERILYIVNNFYKFGGLVFKDYITPILGILVSLRFSTLSKEQKKFVYIIIGFLIAAMFYPAFSGKMWFYHYLIFYYFLSLSGSFILVNLAIKNEIRKKIYSVILLVIFVTVSIPPFWEVFGYAPEPDWARTDRIASVLKNKVKDGDYVQPLDWCDGALHAMLIAKAPLATSIAYNVDLYHHISNKYTIQLRRKFIKEIKRRKPRFIVRIAPEYQAWITGKDTSKEFVELEELIRTNYIPETIDKEFIIYEYKKPRN